VELSALSALVSGISRQTPYGAPVGYFEQLPANVMSQIAGNSSMGSSSIGNSSIGNSSMGNSSMGNSSMGDSSILQARSSAFQVPDASAFQVPDGYFDGFAAQVLARIRSGNVSEDELPPIFRQIGRVTPYQVPEGYWGELSPLLAVLRDKPAYALPEGYFDELSPVLTVAHNRSTYRVHQGYFAELPGQILEKVAEPVTTAVTAAVTTAVTAARVIPMERAETGKVLKGNWWKYSSVASIAACLLLIFSWPQGDHQVTSHATADILPALQKVSDQEMQAYLDDQRTLLADPINNSTATLDVNEGDVKSFLGDVSDNDLKQYMEEHGKADDLATN
jgi:hypothetical protein